MSLSITCACGSRLEIDESFVGKTVPCPDCNRPLLLPAPAPQRQPRVSGLALTSLVVALIGAFTLVGGLVAVALGYFAQRRIEREPGRFGGLNYARAGMAVGAGGTLLTLVMMISPTLFPLEHLLREFEWAGALDYSWQTQNPAQVSYKGTTDFSLFLTPPSRRWGQFQDGGSGAVTDHIILIDVRDDAQIAVQATDLNGDELGDWEAAKHRGLERFYKSGLVKRLGRLPSGSAPPEGTVRDEKPRPGDAAREWTVDLRLGGVNRTFLLRMAKKAAGARLFVLVGGARAGQFAALEDDFRKAFDTFQAKD